MPELEAGKTYHLTARIRTDETVSINPEDVLMALGSRLQTEFTVTELGLYKVNTNKDGIKVRNPGEDQTYDGDG